MKTSHFLTLVLFSVCITGCSTETSDSDEFQIDNPYDGIWQDSPEVPFRFVLEQTYGVEEEPEEEMLAGTSSMTTDKDGNLYVLDNRANRVVSFDENGIFRWTSGREGEGPGEYRRPRSIHWDGEDHLFIGNQAGTRIEILDLSGEYVDSRLIESIGIPNAGLTGFVDPETIVFSSSLFGVIGTRIQVVSLGESWTLSSEFEIDHGGDLQLPAGVGVGPGVDVIGDAIVSGNMMAYRSEFYDTSGRLIRVVTRETDVLVRPGIYQSASGSGVRSFGSLSTPVRVGNSNWLIPSMWPTNVDDPDEFALMARNRQAPDVIYARTLDLYDNQWRLLYSWTVEGGRPGGLGSIIHTDVDGKVFARTMADFPQIGRYRIDISAPD